MTGEDGSSGVDDDVLDALRNALEGYLPGYSVGFRGRHDGATSWEDPADALDDAVDEAVEDITDELHRSAMGRTPFLRRPPYLTATPRLTPFVGKKDIGEALKFELLQGFDDGRTYDEVRAAWRAGVDIADVLELSGSTYKLPKRAVRTRDADDPDPAYLDDATFEVITIDLREIAPEDVR